MNEKPTRWRNGVLVALLMCGIAFVAVRSCSAPLEPDPTPPPDSGGSVIAHGDSDLGSSAHATQEHEPDSRTPVALPAEPREPEPPPAKRLRIFGVVHSKRDSRPLSAGITATAPDGESESTRADGTGHYSIDVPASVFRVDARSMSHAPLRVDLGDLSQVEQLELDLELEPARTIPVRFVDERGASLPAEHFAGPGDAGVRLRVGYSSQPRIAGEPFRADRRSFASIVYLARNELGSQPGLVPPAEAAGLLVEYQPIEGHMVALLGSRCVSSSVPYPCGDELVIAVQRAALEASMSSLHLIVVDETTGLPIERAHVWLLQSYKSGSTGPNGAFTFEHIEPGVWGLQVVAEGYGTQSQVVDLREPRRLDLGLLALQRALELRGRVVDEQGQAMSGFSLHVTEWDEWMDAPTRPEVRIIRTDDQGRFLLGSARRTRYALSLPRGYAAHGQDAWLVDLSQGRKEEVELRLRAGARQRIRIQNPVDHVHSWTITDALGKRISRGRIGLEDVVEATLAPGAYSIAFWDLDAEIGNAAIVVDPAPRGNLRLTVTWK